ncbi:hypothetical protein [Moorena sp. SIO4G3]|uniref:hypothetical protein n=1 Tax=Moorena sp. SIO4G3 TaxID=2607821 RepID=UPI00142AA54B|nr:hypothetical protein [Moorena sp. SIO4G3]NEO79452.1 hypothetical protein [Moorena sp. SIO4G3]
MLESIPKLHLRKLTILHGKERGRSAWCGSIGEKLRRRMAREAVRRVPTHSVRQEISRSLAHI